MNPTLTEMVNSMRAARERLERLGAPLLEHRMHSDDWNELRAKYSAEVYGSDAPMRLDGIRIVLDEEAPRLPRRPA